ncbi:hypothetical protein LOD99_7354 [Oopsacas minuta]|uniref:Uncharacterized protein n=1 Tax=Oopsacas minuta TaxID=111878 RepID=A0AAV7JVC0_9METZ|nr:hypothetical protein LOD99_7354 [Oopsacas minuta]
MNVVSGTYHLFSQKRFRPHRLCGALYLTQFLIATLAEFSPALQKLTHPYIHVTLPITGCLQAIIACRTFTFLPTTKGEVQGYFSDKRTMSYDFILENVYFSGLIVFQSLYCYYPELFHAFPIVEVIFVFLPYFVIRPFFPKTSFRQSLSKTYGGEVSDRNKFFIYANVYFVKVFYIAGKHISGYYINYLLYTNNIPGSYDRTMRLLFLLAGWGATIAVFLHTLKFKHYLSARMAMLLYTGSFPLFYAAYASLYQLALLQPIILLICAVGILINFMPVYVQVLYQCFACLVLSNMK